MLEAAPSPRPNGLYSPQGGRVRVDVSRRNGNLKPSWQTWTWLLLTLFAGFAVFPHLVAARVWPPPMPPEKTAMVYDEEIHYFEAGTGPNIIFLHGMVGTATDWGLTLGPVSRKYHVYALDQIGFGHSDKPKIEYKISTFGDFLQEFMRVQHIPKATIVGNSVGGWIAVDFAATHPDLVDRLVLVDALGLDTPVHHNVPVDMNPSSMEGSRKVWEFLFYNKKLATDAMVRNSWKHREKDGDRNTIQRLVSGLVAGSEFEDSKVGSIRAPTLLIWGRNDVATPLEFGEHFQKVIPGSKLVVIDQCGHVPQIEKPVEFNKTLMEFLAEP
jgi:pimeloyl-ACP methyl ester carboxylesterase